MKFFFVISIVIACFLPSQHQVQANTGVDCTFEQGFCGWTQSSTDQFNWTRHSGATRSPNTGPSVDHTNGTGSGYYIYIEVSGKTENDSARLVSPQLSATNGTCLSFWYHMYGNEINRLSVDINTARVWTLVGEQGDLWKRKWINIRSNVSFVITFEGIAGPDYKGDIALDDVTVKSGYCDIIGFSRSSVTVAETAGQVTVCLTIEDHTAVRKEVRLSTDNNTAKAPEDYTSLTGYNVTFAANETNRCVDLVIKDDNVTEYNETFYIKMTTNDPLLNLKVDRKILTVLITSDDQATIGFNNSSLSEHEGTGHVTVCMAKEGETAIPLDIGLTTVESTAKAPKDYTTLLGYNVTFAADESNKCIDVVIKDDNVTEYNETFYIKMTTNNPNVMLSENRKNLTVVIINDDQAIIGFSESSLSVSEEFGHLTVCMTKEGEAAIPLDVRLSTAKSTAKAPEDYTGFLSSTVTFAANETNKCVDVYIKVDNVTEYDEMFYIIMTTNNPNVILRENRKNLTVVITNDDEATIGFSNSSLSISEGDSHLRVCMTKEGETTISLDVRLSTVDGSAKAPEDYTSLSGYKVTFAANETNRCVDLVIKDDNVTEYNETFYIEMSTSNPAVILKENRKILKIVITNDDQAIVQFKEMYVITVEEGSNEENIELICVTNRISRVPIHISFTVNPSNFTTTAEEDQDFSLRNNSLTFPPGVSTLPLIIDIKKDEKAESDETMLVKMRSLDENNISMIGGNDTARVKITDKIDNEKAEKQRQEQREKREVDRRTVLILFIISIVLVFFIIVIAIISCCFFLKHWPYH